MDKNNCDKPQFSGEWVKLGDVASYINGYAFKPADYASEGKPIIRIQDLTGNAYQTNRFAGNLDDKYRVVWGDVLISWSASLGVYVWSAEEAWLNQHIFKVQFNKLPVNKRFFIHQTRYVIAESASLAHGATMRHLTKKVFDNLPFFYPSEHDQEEIACHLDGIQLQIDSASDMLARLDALVKSRFIEMFGDITEQYLLGERLETTSGGTPSRKHPEYYEGGSIPWLTSGEVNKGKIDTPDHFITEAGLRNSSAKLVPANSVVVAMYGATAGQVGLVTYETTTNQAVCCIKPNACVAPVFLRYALEFKKDWMIDQCAGGAQPNISQGIVKKVAIPDVTLARQQEFADFASQVDKLRFMLLGNPSPTYRSRSFCCSTNSGSGGVILEAKDY